MQALFRFLVFFLAVHLVIGGCHFLARGAALGAIAALDLQAAPEDRYFGLGLSTTFAIAGLLIASGVVVWCLARDQIFKSTQD
jgi:hypothetical protein